MLLPHYYKIPLFNLLFLEFGNILIIAVTFLKDRFNNYKRLIKMSVESININDLKHIPECGSF